MFKNNQTGAALFTALIFLLILTLVGLTALRNSGLSERMSTNAQISQMAFNAAETAANRYKAEYNFNAQVPVTAAQAEARNVRLTQYLPVVALSTSGTAPSPYFEYCINGQLSGGKTPSLLTGYQDTSGTIPVTNFNTDVDCSSIYVDAGASAVTAKNKVVYEDCGKLITSCPGYSGDGDVSCHIFKMEAEGTVADTTAYTDQWVSVLGACIN